MAWNIIYNRLDFRWVIIAMENKFNEIYLLHVESLLQSHLLKSNFLEIFENFHKIGRSSVSILVLMRSLMVQFYQSWTPVWTFSLKLSYIFRTVVKLFVKQKNCCETSLRICWRTLLLFNYTSLQPIFCAVYHSCHQAVTKISQISFFPIVRMKR